MERIAVMDDPYELIEPAKVNALAFLQRVYNDSSESKSVRLRAAIAALPFESPKLAVTATVNGEAFGDALERAIARSSKVQLGYGARMVEHESVGQG